MGETCSYLLMFDIEILECNREQDKLYFSSSSSILLGNTQFGYGMDRIINEQVSTFI